MSFERILRRCALALPLLGLASCTESMVTSVPADLPREAHVGQMYIEYGVANSEIKITIAPAAAASSGADTTAADPAKPNKTTPKAASLTTPNDSVATDSASNPRLQNADYVLAATAPKKPTKAKKPTAKKPAAQADATPPDSLETWCAKELKAYDDARVVVAKTNLNEDALYYQLTHLIVDPQSVSALTSEQKVEVVADLRHYLDNSSDAAMTVARKSVATWKGQVDSLKSLCREAMTATITEVTEPSLAHNYRLYVDHDFMSNDTFTALQSGGFLTSASATADDQTGGVLIGVAKSLASVAFLVAPQATLALAGAGGVPFAGGGKAKFSRATVEREWKYLQTNHGRDDLAEALNHVNDLTAALQLYLSDNDLEILNQALPLEIDLDVSTLGKAGDTSVAIANKRLKGLNLQLIAACRSLPLAGPNIATPMEKKSAGIVVSESRPCMVELDRVDSAGTTVLARTGVWAQDASDVYTLPMKRSVFVLEKTSYEFAGGRLSKVDVSRPSEALQIATLPFNIIGAFFSAISNGVTGKTSVITDETDRLKAQAALISAKAALLKAQQPDAKAPTSPAP